MARILPGLVRNRSKAVPAIVAAVLFGLATPAIKIELLVSNPVALATFLYLGAGTGIFIVSITKSRPGCFAGIRRSLLSESAGLAGTIIIGGILAPVIQFTALSITPAATASLLLNFEIIATALVAWGIFHENVSRTLFIAIVAVFAGSLVLSLDTASSWCFSLGAAGIICSCFFWGLDNNLMGTIRGADPCAVVIIKGLAGGGILLLALIVFRVPLPDPEAVLLIVLTGFLTFGLGLVFLIESLRSIGIAMTAAYLATAPLIGAFGALALAFEVPGPQFLVSLPLFVAGLGFLIWDRSAGTLSGIQRSSCSPICYNPFPKIRASLAQILDDEYLNT